MGTVVEVPDEKVLFLSDIFPTGYMAAENAEIEPSDTATLRGPTTPRHRLRGPYDPVGRVTGGNQAIKPGSVVASQGLLLSLLASRVRKPKNPNNYLRIILRHRSSRLRHPSISVH
jgi:hypothetical protein